VISLQIAF